MSDHPSRSCTAFRGQSRLISGPLDAVALGVKRALDGGAAETILVFDDTSGRIVDLDLRGSDDEIVARLCKPAQSYQGRYRPASAEPAAEAPEARGRGRPRLGVVAREVTLLPRQWDWLAAQPGGASPALRRLVDDARRNGSATQRKRQAQEAAYHFMLAMAGDLPGYEEATRALFAGDIAGLEQRVAAWPEDIRTHVLRLAAGVGEAE